MGESAVRTVSASQSYPPGCAYQVTLEKRSNRARKRIDDLPPGVQKSIGEGASAKQYSPLGSDSFIHGVINILAREAATYPKYWMNP